MNDKKDLKPEIIVEVRDQDIGLEGYLVIDNANRGVGKGGIRMSADLSRGEVERLARVMSLKNALAELPFGGAKAGIVWPKDRYEDKKQLFDRFVEAIAPYLGERYVAAPDINTGEEEMSWLVDITGNPKSTTGKPAEDGGLKDKSMATGFGVAVAAEVAAEHLGLNLDGMTVAIDGYGTVGRHACHELEEQGARVVAVSDSTSGIYLDEGFRYGHLDELKDSRQHQLNEYEGAKTITHDELRTLDVDVLVLSSISDVITEDNQSKVEAKIIVEGANLPIRENIEAKLDERGVLVMPDIVANAGGVIASWLEYDRPETGRSEMLQIIRQKISSTSKNVLEASARQKTYPRDTALEIAQSRLNHSA